MILTGLLGTRGMVVPGYVPAPVPSSPPPRTKPYGTDLVASGTGNELSGADAGSYFGPGSGTMLDGPAGSGLRCPGGRSGVRSPGASAAGRGGRSGLGSGRRSGL